MAGEPNRGFNMNEFDPAAQQIMESEIRRGQIDKDLREAHEHIPESFGSVVMLYVPLTVNGKSVQAFVDSGAQVTIMSLACAERCNLGWKIDKRFTGSAKGVGHGVQKIIGRIHVADIKLGNASFPCSFTVIDQTEPELLFGLDLLRKFQCSIDLRSSENCLRVGNEKVKFLSEHELRKERTIPFTEQDSPGSPAGGRQASRMRQASSMDPAGSAANKDIEREKLRKLCSVLEVSEEVAQDLLNQAGGDVDMAAALFYQ
eukprot:Selendium_serpulae@DN5717_c0_g1_i2.p1